MTAKEQIAHNKFVGMRKMLAIKNELCEHCNIPLKKSKYKDRKKQAIDKRYPVIFIMLLIKRCATDGKLNKVAERHIAKMWNKEAHATIRYAYKKVEMFASLYPECNDEIRKLAEFTYERFGIDVRECLPQLMCREHYARD
jgi:hypothetical protein